MSQLLVEHFGKQDSQQEHHTSSYDAITLCYPCILYDICHIDMILGISGNLEPFQTMFPFLGLLKSKVAKGCHNLATEKNPKIWTQKYVKFYHNNFWIKISVIRAFSSQRVFSYPISKTIFRFSELDIYFCPFFKSSKYFWKKYLKIYRLQKSLIYIIDF